MKWILLILLLFSFINAEEDLKKHQLFLTVYGLSIHFTKNGATGEEYNERHRVYGFEYINKDVYTLTYNNFLNSRGNEVDIYGVGYLLHFNDSFGLHISAGYQEGYCFEGLLNSVECDDSKSDRSVFILPLLYYKNDFIKIDFFTNSRMISFRFNIRIY